MYEFLTDLCFIQYYRRDGSRKNASFLANITFFFTFFIIPTKNTVLFNGKISNQTFYDQLMNVLSSILEADFSLTFFGCLVHEPFSVLSKTTPQKYTYVNKFLFSARYCTIVIMTTLFPSKPNSICHNYNSWNATGECVLGTQCEIL